MQSGEQATSRQGRASLMSSTDNDCEMALESQDFEGESELKEILPGHSVKEKNLNCICDHPYKEPRYHSDVISVYKGLFIQPLTHKTNARAKI